MPDQVSVDIANILASLKSPKSDEKVRAIRECAQSGSEDQQMIDALIGIAGTDDDSTVRLEAIHALWKLGHDRDVPIPGLDTQAASPSVSEPVTARPARYSSNDLQKQVRSWAIWSLILGAAHLIANNFLNPFWGILLIVVGLFSFFFRTSAMFVLYGTTLLWAAISNVLSRETGWIGFSVIQLIMVVSIFRDYYRFRKTEREGIVNNGLDEKQTDNYRRTSSLYPILGFILGLFSLGGIVLFFLIIFVKELSSPQTAYTETANIILAIHFGVSEIAAVMALGICVGALLSGFRRKALSIIGIIASLLVIIVHVFLIFNS